MSLSLLWASEYPGADAEDMTDFYSWKDLPFAVAFPGIPSGVRDTAPGDMGGARHCRGVAVPAASLPRAIPEQKQPGSSGCSRSVRITDSSWDISLRINTLSSFCLQIPLSPTNSFKVQFSISATRLAKLEENPYVSPRPPADRSVARCPPPYRAPWASTRLANEITRTN